MARIQQDTVSLHARSILQILRGDLEDIAKENESLRAAASLLLGWDADCAIGSGAAALVPCFYHRLTRHLLTPALGEDRGDFARPGVAVFWEIPASRSGDGEPRRRPRRSHRQIRRRHEPLAVGGFAQIDAEPSAGCHKAAQTPPVRRSVSVRRRRCNDQSRLFPPLSSLRAHRRRLAPDDRRSGRTGARSFHHSPRPIRPFFIALLHRPARLVAGWTVSAAGGAAIRYGRGTSNGPEIP